MINLINSIFDSFLETELFRLSLFDFRETVHGIFILAISIILAFILSFLIYEIVVRISDNNWLYDNDNLALIILTIILTLIFFSNFGSIPILDIIFTELRNYIFSLDFLTYDLIITVGTAIMLGLIVVVVIVGVFVFLYIIRNV